MAERAFRRLATTKPLKAYTHLRKWAGALPSHFGKEFCWSKPMPNCFQLIDRHTKEPVAFTEVDRLMCEHFNTPCHETEWHHMWYPILMEWGIALGLDWAKQREHHRLTAKKFRLQGDEEGAKGEEHILDIIDWLDSCYIADAWAEIGRR